MPEQTPSKYARCPICGRPSVVVLDLNIKVSCFSCSDYSTTKEALLTLQGKNPSERQLANVSGYLRENRGSHVTSAQVDFLLQLRTPNVFDRATKLLRHWANRYPSPGFKIPDARNWFNDASYLRQYRAGSPVIDADLTASQPTCEVLAATWSNASEELLYLLVNCLRDDAQFVEVDELVQATIAPLGWRHLESAPHVDSSVGFVAMWFADETNPVWQDAIYPAIYEAGYQPERIDKREHNNKIDDEIIAAIRGAKFVVADFTKHRGGVYFEAGFAIGLGKPVIWTVREDELSGAHFDTRQFNHIVWDDNDVQSFRKALQLRIEATLGRGPLRRDG